MLEIKELVELAKLKKERKTLIAKIKSESDIEVYSVWEMFTTLFSIIPKPSNLLILLIIARFVLIIIRGLSDSILEYLIKVYDSPLTSLFDLSLYNS